MLKFWSVLIGKDFNQVSTWRKSSQEKVILFGNILLIPVTLWGLNGYLMSREIFGMGVVGSILTGLVLSFIIFLIERSILLASTSKVINRLRVVLGVIVAILGSLTIDEVIFKNDIDNQIQKLKVEDRDLQTKKMDDLWVFRIDSVSREVGQKTLDYNKKSNDYYLEIEGKANSGVGGEGPMAERKKLLMERAYETLKSEQEVLKSMRDTYNSKREFAETDSKENFNDKGLLLRMRAMFGLIFSDIVSFIVFFLYFLLVLIMETLVIIMKKFTPKSPDEELEEMGDRLLISKHRKWIEERKNKYDLDI